jgi:hypothetical protein
MRCDQHVLQVDPVWGRRYISRRSEQPERPSQGTEVGTPGKAVRTTGRICHVRSGQLTGCAGGEARESPKPNERVYGQETETAVRGCSGHSSPRG